MNTKLVMLAVLSLTIISCTRPHTETAALNENPATTSNQARYNGYIVKSSKEGESAIRRIYSKFGIVTIKFIGNDQFELNLQNDPGLLEMESLANQSSGAVKAIQPNYIYKAL